jgi:hypothetical protein
VTTSASGVKRHAAASATSATNSADEARGNAAPAPCGASSWAKPCTSVSMEIGFSMSPIAAAAIRASETSGASSSRSIRVGRAERGDGGAIEGAPRRARAPGLPCPSPSARARSGRASRGSQRARACRRAPRSPTSHSVSTPIERLEMLDEPMRANSSSTIITFECRSTQVPSHSPSMCG